MDGWTDGADGSELGALNLVVWAGWAVGLGLVREGEGEGGGVSEIRMSILGIGSIGDYLVFFCLRSRLFVSINRCNRVDCIEGLVCGRRRFTRSHSRLSTLTGVAIPFVVVAC